MIHCQTKEPDGSSYITATLNINVRPSVKLQAAVRQTVGYQRIAFSEKAPGIESVINLAPNGLASAAKLNLEVRTKYTENGVLRATRFNTMLMKG